MTELLDETTIAISNSDWQSLQTAIFKLANLSNATINELLEILKTLPSILAMGSKASTTESTNNENVFLQYELIVWKIGEAYRQILQRNRSLCCDPTLLHEIERVALDSNYGKGRQSFVMLLGKYGSQNAISSLKVMLQDKDVQGYVVYALRVIGAPEVQDDIRPFLQSPKTWIRDEAKKYFMKIEK